jgi:(4-(4-[2-(gamma-L-glutamylamino)ethyl]phenoxymethyl)furan-2-yl)methanamine synthase
LDIGGANTKAAFVKTKNGRVEKTAAASEYLPMWKCPEKLPATLKDLAKRVAGHNRLDLVTVTMTAELADSYQTKREGVNHILDDIEKAFPDEKVLVVDIEGKLRTFEEAKLEPEKVAAANWAATGWLISQLKRDCIAIDVGSTTTSIIPFHEGKVLTEGKNDLEKLILGELVYTGSLRTNVATIVKRIPLKKGNARVSSESFAQSADVHLILGNISQADYTVDTNDGKEKTRKAALARLARVVCADTEMLSEEEIVGMAECAYAAQVKQIAQALTQVSAHFNSEARYMTAVVTGLGRNFLARKAAEQVGFAEIEDLGDFVGNVFAKVSTAFALAVMGASLLEGGVVNWTR